MQKINTPKAPLPAGHYSQAVVSKGMVYVSGQLGIKPDGAKMIGEPIEDQTRQIFDNIKVILAEAGSSIEQIVSVTIYVSDGENWTRVNQTYIDVFGDHKPARAVVPTRDLHYGLDIEITVIAEVL